MDRHAQAKRTRLDGAAAGKVGPEQNYLLSALSSAERERVFPALKQVYLPLGGVLYESGSVVASSAGSESLRGCRPELRLSQRAFDARE